MATILIKKRDTTGAPSAGDLTNSAGGAEVAVNTFDKRLFAKNSGGTVVELGTAPSTIDINAGSIDGTPIGANSASTGVFTTLSSNSTTTLNGTVVPASKTLLVSTDIGVTVQGYDADTAKYDDATANFTGTLQNGGSNVVVDTDIGSTVQAFDADTAKYDDTTANFTGTLQNGGSNVVVDTDIGSTVQGYDADTAKYDDTTANFTGTLQNGGSNVVVDTDIGSTVQAYDADTAKYDDVTANFTGTLQNGGSDVLVDTDIGSTVQGYDADTAKYDDTTANFTGTLQNGGSNVLVDTDIGSTVQGYDADTAKYDDTTANFTGTLQNGGSNVVVDTDIGSAVLAYDSNLQSFVTTFTLPTTDGTVDQVLKTDGAGNIGFATVSGGGGGLTYVVKTANYTTQNNEGVLADTSGGAFTVTLPATPSTGDQVVVADPTGDWGTNNLTIGRNGETISDVAQDLICDISGASVQLVYDGTTWAVYAQVGGNGGTVVTLDGVQTLTNKTLTSPTLTTPVLGTPQSGTLTNTTGLPLSTGVTGTLPVANGGTGATSLTAENVILGDGTSAVKFVAPSTSGNVLTSNGTTWTSATPAGGGSLVFLSTVTASSSATVDVETTFNSTYDVYLLVISGVTLSDNSQPLRVTFKMGGSYDTGSNYSRFVDIGNSNTTTPAPAAGEAETDFTLGNATGNAAGRAFNATMRIFNPSSTSLVKFCTWEATTYTGTLNRMQHINGSAMNKLTTAFTGIRFTPGSGNIASGSFRLYGIKNS